MKRSAQIRSPGDTGTTVARRRSRSRGDTHEQQAKLAARLLTGEVESPLPAARFLTPAPAAARVDRPYRLSRGEPLPGALLHRLEGGFGANLAAVRVHNDEVAWEAALAEGARAFTSGRDIYFAPGEYQPGTQRGFALLAHEVAHVLQQTGRATGSDGLLTAYDRHGSGALQHDEADKFSYPITTFASDYRLIAAALDNSPETKAALDKVFSAVEAAMTADGNTLVQEETGKGSALKALADEVAARTKGMKSKERAEKAKQWYELPALARSALMDLMKFTHNFEAAAVLLKRDPTLRTVNSYDPFLQYLARTMGKDWFVEHIDSIAPIKDVFPDAAAITVWDYLTHPSRKPTYVKPFHDLAKKYFDGYKDQVKKTILRDNERVYGAYIALREASEFVFNLLNHFEVVMSDMQPAMRRRLAAQALVGLYKDPASLESLSEQKLAVPIQAAAQRALEFWTKADDLLKAVTGEAQKIVEPEKEPPAGEKAPVPSETPATPPAPEPIPEVPEKVWSNSLYKEFVADVNSGLTGILGSAGGTPTLLNADDYKTALGTLRAALEKHRVALSEHISTLIVWDTSGNPEKFDEAVWFAVAQLVIDRLMIELNGYDEKREGTFDRQYGGLPDVRLSHRYDMARASYRVAKFTRDSKLEAAARTVLEGKDLGYSYMAFTGDWKRENKPVEDIAKDLTPNLPIIGLGTSVQNLIGIYRLLRSLALVDHLTRLLDTYKDDYAIESYGLIAKAQKAAREQVPFPARWVADRAFVIWNDKDKDVAGARSLSELMRAHPRFIELIQKEENAEQVAVIANDRSTNPVVWMLPNLDTIRSYVYSIPTLADLLETRTGPDATLDELLLALNDVAKKAQEARNARLKREADEGADIPLTPIEEELEKLLAAIGVQTTTERQHARAIETELYIQSTIRDRKVIELAAGKLLDQYAENDDITNYSLPTRAIDMIDHFSRNIVPDSEEHVSAQMALLLLSLADNLENAFIEDDEVITQIFGSVTEDRYDIITGIWGHINAAIDYAQGKAGVKKEGDKPLDSGAVARQLRPYVAKGESVRTLLADGTAALIRLRDAFRTVIIATQMKSGIIGSKSPHELRRVDGRGSVAVGLDAEPLRYEGISYIVTQIERDFTFHPAYGTRGTGSYVQSILKNPDGSDIPRDASIILLRYIIGDGEETTITASLDDEHALNELATAAVITDIVRGLEATADLIESAFKLGRDIASLFVPGGPVAVLLMDMAEFMMQDMPVIREDIIDAPMRAVRALEEFVSPEMRDKMIEKVWLYLLFEGDLPFAEALMGLSKKKESRTSSRRKGKFGKLAAFAKNVGLRILEAFFGLQMRVRAGMIRASRVVQRKALLKQLVRALPRIIALGSSLQGKDLEQGEALLGDLVKGNAPEQINKSLREALDELFDGLNGLTVPSEILPLDLVVEIVMERLIRSMGAKGKIVQKLMEVSRFQTEAAEKVAEVLRSQGLDPNILWQETVQDELQGMLNEARDGLLAGVNSLLKTYLGDFFVVPDEGLATIEIGKDEAVPALEPLLTPAVRLDEEDDEEDQQNPARHIPPRVDPYLGQPLPAALREHYEDLFGHDLRHVRLHVGRDAARLTRFYRADALTSGSHIFLGENLAPTSARADRVLRHEMAHVLQQTGARPLGLQHDPDPILGDRGRGLQVNPRREHAAEQMARAAVSRGTDPVPVREEDLLGGFMPELSETIKLRVIEYLGSDKLAQTFVEQVDSLKSVPSKISVEKRGQFEAVVTAAESIWADVDKLLRTKPTGGTAKNPPPFDKDPAIEGVKTYFKRGPVPMPRNPIIRALAFYSFDEVGGKLKLDHNRYKVNLENYLYAKTGVDIKIDYRKSGTTPDVEFVRINYIDLGDVSGGSKMYKNMKAGTDAHMAKHVATLGKPFNSVEWGKIREYLRGGAAEREPWDNNEYRLSDGFINEMREFVNATTLGQVGTWENYVKTDDVANPLYGGLRVGTHGQLRGKATGHPDLEPAAGQPGAGAMTSVAYAGRQSHHLPQFLLVEYFQDDNKRTVSRSVKGRKSFPPGFQVQGSRAVGFDDGSGHTLDFQKLDPNPSERGLGLPAVSLAAKTHQKGQLHINGTTTWGDYKKLFDSIEVVGQGTQGVKLDDTFYKFMKQELSGVKGISASTAPELVIEKACEDPKANAPKVLKAIQKTYMWMYKGMKFALQRTLTKSIDHEEHFEAISYQAFAMSMPDTTETNADGEVVLKKGYQPRNTGLAEVVNAVELKNRKIMKDWWTT